MNVADATTLLVSIQTLIKEVCRMIQQLADLQAAQADLSAKVDLLLAHDGGQVSPAALQPVTDALKAASAKIDAQLNPPAPVAPPAPVPAQ
jgi:hypothetical protein